MDMNKRETHGERQAPVHRTLQVAAAFADGYKKSWVGRDSNPEPTP